jgi:hypothetical protein
LKKATEKEHAKAASEVNTSHREGVHTTDSTSPSGSDYSTVQLSCNANSINGKPNPYYYNTQSKSYSFLSAIFETGRLLGISCGQSFPSKSKPAPPGTPECLQPTLLQRSTVHWQWIDRFPFPDFRDEIIVRSGEIDEEEFLGDLYDMEPFTLAPGGSPTDPYVYSMNPEFKAKWGYLFPSFCGDPQVPGKLPLDLLPSYPSDDTNNIIGTAEEREMTRV